MTGTEGPESLPSFPYHPDPLATGSVTRSETECICCCCRRGYIYVGPAYPVEDLDDKLCPWCIADGSVAERYEAVFTEVDGQVPVGVVDAVETRTPGSSAGSRSDGWSSVVTLPCDLSARPGALSVFGSGGGARAAVFFSPEGPGQDARVVADEVSRRDVADDGECIGPEGDLVVVMVGGVLGPPMVRPAKIRAAQGIGAGDLLRAVTESADHERLLPEALNVNRPTGRPPYGAAGWGPERGSPYVCLCRRDGVISCDYSGASQHVDKRFGGGASRHLVAARRRDRQVAGRWPAGDRYASSSSQIRVFLALGGLGGAATRPSGAVRPEPSRCSRRAPTRTSAKPTGAASHHCSA
jgi:hypothetical protein